MKKTGALTKVLAIAGAVLVWFPILATVFFAAAGSMRAGRLRLDYLMPAELFPAALAGFVLLLWAALRARDRRALVGWSGGIMVGSLVGSMAFAIVSGLASGAREAGGVWLVVLQALLVAYVVALVVLAVAGILLLVDLFRAVETEPTPLAAE